MSKVRIYYRVLTPSTRPVLLIVSVVAFVVAWLADVEGFITSIVALSFTPSATLTSRSLHKRADDVKAHFHTPHGIGGLVIFIPMHFVLPLVIAMILAQNYHEERDRRDSRVSDSSSGEGEYKDDPGAPNSPPARPRQSSSADKLFWRPHRTGHPRRRMQTTTMMEIPSAPGSTSDSARAHLRRADISKRGCGRVGGAANGRSPTRTRTRAACGCPRNPRTTTRRGTRTSTTQRRRRPPRLLRQRQRRASSSSTATRMRSCSRRSSSPTVHAGSSRTAKTWRGSIYGET